jgi:putative membrane protein
MASTSPGAATHRGSLFFRPCGILRRMRIIIKWLLSAVALLAVAYLYSGVQVNSFGSALIAAAVIGLLNAVVRPVLVVLTLPVTIVTLGLFLFIINALMFWSASGLLGGFQVNGLLWRRCSDR